jgi:hypothetical protein
MKTKILFLIPMLLLLLSTKAQVTAKILGDSVKVTSSGGLPGELIIENSSRFTSKGFLQNIGNGRTKFALAIDSVWQDGSLLYFRRGNFVQILNVSANIVFDSLFFYANPDQFTVSTGTSVVGVGSQLNLAPAITDKLDDILTRDDGDLVYYPLHLNPAGYLTRSKIYHNGYGMLMPNDSTFAVDITTLNTLYPQLAGSYVNPSWITSLNYSKINGGNPNAIAFFNASGSLSSSSLLTFTNGTTELVGVGGVGTYDVVNSWGNHGALQMFDGDWAGQAAVRNSLALASWTDETFIVDASATPTGTRKFKWIGQNSITTLRLAALYSNYHFNIGDTTDFAPTDPNPLLHVHKIIADSAIIGGVVSGVGGSYTLPVASASTLGGIKVGGGLAIAGDGTLSASGGSGYTETKDRFTSSTSTAKTLAHTPAFPSAILVFWNGILQDTGQYSISGTTVTLTATPSSSDVITIKYSY